MKMFASIKLILISCLCLISCAGASMTPTHEARIVVDPSKYEELTAALDASMASIGLSRYNSGPELDALVGRPVFYITYRKKISDKDVFLDAMDIKKRGVIEFSVYSQFFPKESERDHALKLIEDFVRERGGNLTVKIKR